MPITIQLLAERGSGDCLLECPAASVYSGPSARLLDDSKFFAPSPKGLLSAIHFVYHRCLVDMLRRFNGLLYCHSLKPSDHARVSDFVLPAPSSKALCFAVACVYFVSSGVLRLFAFCCPATISRLVVSIVVDAVYGHSSRHISHVGMKRRKAFSPTFAHFNSSTTIIPVSYVTGIVASSFHVFKANVHSRSRKAMRSICLFCEAAATFGSSILQTARMRERDTAALAAALPFCFTSLIGRSFKHDKPPKLLSSEIDKIWHSPLLPAFVGCNANLILIIIDKGVNIARGTRCL